MPSPRPTWAPRRRLPVSAAPLAVLALIWAGVAATVGWWWMDTARIHGLAGWLIAAGVVMVMILLTGLLALRAVLNTEPAEVFR